MRWCAGHRCRRLTYHPLQLQHQAHRQEMAPMATRVTNCEKAENERHVCEKAIYFFGIEEKKKNLHGTPVYRVSVMCLLLNLFL